MARKTFIFTEIPAGVTGSEARYVFRGRYLTPRGYATALGLIRSFAKTKKMYTGWGADNILNELLKPENTGGKQDE
jgi:hypothetical protein